MAQDIMTLDSYVARRNFFNFLGITCRLLDFAGGLLFYVKLAAFKLKEDITLYEDEEKTRPLINIKARKMLDFAATYDVVDVRSQQALGALRRKGFKSILRDEWEILNTQDQVVGKILEDSLWLGLLRRLIFKFLPQNYTISLMDRPIGQFRGSWNPFIHKITVDFNGDPQRQLDRRLGAAAAVMILCIEGKQN